MRNSYEELPAAMHRDAVHASRTDHVEETDEQEGNDTPWEDEREGVARSNGPVWRSRRVGTRRNELSWRRAEFEHTAGEIERISHQLGRNLRMQSTDVLEAKNICLPVSCVIGAAPKHNVPNVRKH